jgi:hypothetical protein
VFDCLGRPSFFDEAVDLVMERLEQGSSNSQNSSCASAPREVGEQGNGKSMRFAPQLSWIRELAQEDAFRLRREIELRFVRTGVSEMPKPHCEREKPN